MRLRDLLNYDRIVIQCHDNPDPDALASGFGVWSYLKSHGKEADFVYGGREEISKPNLRLMVSLFSIPVRHVTELASPDLLVLTDCQYGETNTQKFQAGAVAVIDHHEVADQSNLPEMCRVMENYGSCATVVYEMLREEGFDLASDTLLQTALFYGLYTDTVRLQELWHPADKDMWDDLGTDSGIIKKLKNANIDEEDLAAIGRALIRRRICEKYKYGFIETATGDPNILGIVSDTLLEVDTVDVAVAYAYMPRGVKISVRSCLKEVQADELAKVIAEGIGNAGGHTDKAGGLLLEGKVFPEGMTDPWEKRHYFEGLLEQRLRTYFEDTDTIPAGQIIDLKETLPDGSPMYRLYRKLPTRTGVVDLAKHFKAGTKLKVRTLEGETAVTVSGDTLLMLGIHDEPYPIEREKFLKKYLLTGKKFSFSGEYDPIVRDQQNGKKVPLDGITEECVSTGTAFVYARRLKKRTHVFNLWNTDRYAYGKAGDWFAVMKDDPQDYYIIQGYIFDETYGPAE